MKGVACETIATYVSHVEVFVTRIELESKQSKPFGEGGGRGMGGAGNGGAIKVTSKQLKID